MDQETQIIATGFLGDVLLGGAYYRYASRYERAFGNILTSLGIKPWFMNKPMTHKYLKDVASIYIHQAKHRLRYYEFLLHKELRQACREAVSKLESELEAVFQAYMAQAQNISIQQIIERFGCEHRDRKFVFAQELLIHRLNNVLLPTSDRDFANLLTNISPSLKQDHC